MRFVSLSQAMTAFVIAVLLVSLHTPTMVPLALALDREIGPVAVDTAQPITAHNHSSETISPEALRLAAVRVGAADYPHPDAYAKAKEAARLGLDPVFHGDVGQAHDLEEFGDPEPNHATNVAFGGLNTQTAADGVFSARPDTTLAASRAKVLEGVNFAFRLFTTSGTVVDTKTLNTFFSYPINGDYDKILHEPRVFYDHNAAYKRFYVLALDRQSSPNISRIFLAVSRSDNPTSLASAQWCRYYFNTKRNSEALESASYYPTLGASGKWIGIGTTQLTFSIGTFTFAMIWALNKLTLANNASNCPTQPTVSAFQPATSWGESDFFGLHPVQAYTNPSNFAGTSNPLYVIGTLPAASNAYRLIRIKDGSGTTPTMAIASGFAGSFTYGLPPDAKQPGTKVLLDTGSQRITGAAGIGDTIYAVHATICHLGSGDPEACVRYVRVLVGQSAAGAPTGALNQQIVFGASNTFYWWPNIAARTDGAVVVTFQRSSSGSGFLSAYLTGKAGAAGTFETPQLVTGGAGTCSRTRLAETVMLTGQYTGVQRDADNVRFWVAGERAVPLTGWPACHWDTRIAKVTP